MLRSLMTLPCYRSDITAYAPEISGNLIQHVTFPRIPPSVNLTMKTRARLSDAHHPITRSHTKPIDKRLLFAILTACCSNRKGRDSLADPLASASASLGTGELGSLAAASLACRPLACASRCPRHRVARQASDAAQASGWQGGSTGRRAGFSA